MEIGIIPLIFLGLVAGALAKWIMPGDDPGGIIITILLGIAGALIGGLLIGPLFGATVEGFFDLGSWLLAILGAIIVLAIYRAIAGRKTVRG